MHVRCMPLVDVTVRINDSPRLSRTLQRVQSSSWCFTLKNDIESHLTGGDANTLGEPLPAALRWESQEFLWTVHRMPLWNTIGVLLDFGAGSSLLELLCKPEHTGDLRELALTGAFTGLQRGSYVAIATRNA